MKKRLRKKLRLGEFQQGQERRLDDDIAKARADFAAGRGSGPFDTAEEMIAHLHAGVEKAKKRRKKAKRS